MTLEWRENLTVGVDEIDNQHKELFNRINGLFEACSKGKGKEEVKHIVNFLAEYVVEHFGDEEKLQQEVGYPEYKVHKQLHENFIRDFNELKVQIEASDITANFVVQINKLIVDWLINHISISDKALGNYIRVKNQSRI